MFVASSRHVDSGIQIAKLAEQRRAELARLNTLVADAKREAEGLISWAKAEAARLLDEARAEAARIEGVESAVRPPVIDIIRSVSRRRHMSVATIVGPRKDRLAVAVRHEAMAIAYRLRPDLSTTQIGKAFGNRDHTTVLHALRKQGITGDQRKQG